MSKPSHSTQQMFCRTCFRAECPTLTAPGHERYVEEKPYSFPVRGTRLTPAGEDCLSAARRLREEYPFVARWGVQDARKCVEAGSVLETAQNAPERLPAIAPCSTCPDVPGGHAYCPECGGAGSV